MATNNNTTTFYNGNTAISWRSLQQNFEPSGASDPVRFSEFYRNTDVDTNHPDLVVPDATENASIPTSGRIEASEFRGSIKEYVVTQSGSENTYDMDSTPSWNSNLTRNVFKRMRVTGSCNATSVSNSGAHFDGLAYNLRIEVDGGSINGFHGNGAQGNDCTQRNGEGGGRALYVRNTSTRTQNPSRVEVQTLNSGTIRGGGGGGASGSQGSGGGSLNCDVSSDYTYTVWNNHSYNGNRACNVSSCDANRTINYAADSNRGHTGNHSYTGNLNNSGNAYNAGNCWGQRGSRGRCRGRWDRGQPCHPVWNKKCMYTANFTIQAVAGCGGNGGDGQGVGNTGGPGGGNNGLAGQRAHCNTNNNHIVGNSGNGGASGGNWGSSGGNSGNANGGAAGHAINSGDGRTSDIISGNSGISGPMNNCSVGANP